jgi:hypothetical protein
VAAEDIRVRGASSMGQDEHKPPIIEGHRTELRKEALAEQGFALERTNARCDIADGVPAYLQLSEANHITDRLRAIGQSVPALSDKVPVCQRTGTDQRQSDICRYHYVSSAGL